MTSASRAPSPIDKFRRGTAKRLRRGRTEPELRLWRALRKLPLVGSHFRQQVPIGPYVADLAYMAARLVIELDGSQHGERATSIADRERSRWLESEGYRVLRFWNSELDQNLNGVLEVIYAEVH
ncbi:MAG: endonuclease domain-containing protein, partial [Bauldia sp.]